MNARSTDAWQVILADLSLILFLLAIAGYGASQTSDGVTRKLSIGEDSQAIFREQDGSSGLVDWIATQNIDPRAQLTIVATYTPEKIGHVWKEVQRLFSEAQSTGHAVRIVIEAGESDDVYVIIAFDRVGNSF